MNNTLKALITIFLASTKTDLVSTLKGLSGAELNDAILLIEDQASDYIAVHALESELLEALEVSTIEQVDSRLQETVIAGLYELYYQYSNAILVQADTSNGLYVVDSFDYSCEIIESQYVFSEILGSHQEGIIGAVITDSDVKDELMERFGIKGI